MQVTRKTYLQTVALFLAAAILSCVLIVVWALLIIPVMISPKMIFRGINPTEMVMKQVMTRTIRQMNQASRVRKGA